MKELPIEKTEGTHYNDKDMERRLKIYKENNTEENNLANLF